MNDIRMIDERNEEGTGFLTIERLHECQAWTVITRTWFYRGKVDDIAIFEDDVGQITIAQHTTKEYTWTKKQVAKRHGSWVGTKFNYTKLVRKVSKKKCKKDC